jgi:outer membrane protein assembly factor BamB
MKKLSKLLIVMFLTTWLMACLTTKETKFATDAPVKKIISQFQSDLIFQSSPNEKVIIGKKNLEPAIYEISGFEAETGQQIWKLPFVGEVVGQTEKQILVYEEKTNSVHFINPEDGQMTRKISPAPAPLSSKNSLERGMAFTDEMYLTTKSLYTQVIANGQVDESWKIGMTAKTWENNEQKWFVAPVKQIVNIEYKPVIFTGYVLIINPKQSIDGGHSYQIISLKTGEEITRKTTDGEYFDFGKGLFIEKTSNFVRQIKPFAEFFPQSNKELWKVDGDFKNAKVSVIGKQISIATPHTDHTQTILVIDADTGKELKKFDLPDLKETILEGVFVTKDNQIWLNFAKDKYKNADLREYDYLVGYDVETQKALWRTEFKNPLAASLLDLASDKMKIE